MSGRPRRHASLRLTVDLAILTVRHDALHVLLVERGHDPYQGQLALPGGFVREDEDVEHAAGRELREETALDSGSLHLEQLEVFGAPGRDPRGRVVSVPFLAIAPNLPVPVAGSDASGARWEPVDAALTARPRLAFDHHDILETAVERARRELEYTTVATAFCGTTFTIGDLRKVYEVVWGRPLDPRNFNRKVTRTEGFVEPAGAKRVPETGRPAALYRRGSATKLYPPMLRSQNT
jgi:8-oxo-dGTP diphosphatase